MAPFQNVWSLTATFTATSDEAAVWTALLANVLKGQDAIVEIGPAEVEKITLLPDDDQDTEDLPMITASLKDALAQL